jgi:hypothetical protein
MTNKDIQQPKVFDADKFADGERKQRSDTILARYNAFYNTECSALPHGTPITPEFQQAITLRSMLDALTLEHMNQEYSSIEICDVEDLIDGLYQQGKDYLERGKYD